MPWIHREHLKQEKANERTGVETYYGPQPSAHHVDFVFDISILSDLDFNRLPYALNVVQP